MRRWLIRVFAAVSAMVAIAFVVPLALLIRTTAEDRALDSARADAAAVIPSLVSGASEVQVEAAAGSTVSGASGRMSVYSVEGWIIGADVDSDRVAAARSTGESAIGDTRGGKEVVTAVSSNNGQISVVRVFVPRSDLRKGQWAAWGVLAAVAGFLTGFSILIADRLARSIVRPTVDLAVAAERFGAGDLHANVEPSGPPELVALGETFNALGSRISATMQRERELLAELSHRLRTPLTPMRMKIDNVVPNELADQLRADVDTLTLIINALIEDARRGARRVGGESCDAVHVVADRVEYWSVLAEDQDRRWRFRQRIDNARVAISTDDLGAAVDVLIENAFTHTEDGTGIEVAIASADGELCISVSDEGGGFSEELIEAGRSGTGSTGLGLHIARHTVESAGGRILVSATSGGGAEVSLILPVVSVTG